MINIIFDEVLHMLIINTLSYKAKPDSIVKGNSETIDLIYNRGLNKNLYNPY